MDRSDTNARALAVSVGSAAFGACVGLAIAWTSTQRPSPPWTVWAMVTTSMTASAAALFPFGIRRWQSLGGLDRADRRAVTGQLAGIGIVGAMAGVVYQVVSGAAGGRFDWRAGLLILTTVVGSAPVAATIVGTGRVARPVGRSPAEDIDRLIQLRRVQQGMLGALSGIVALLVISAATGEAMYGQGSPQRSLLFGALMSALVVLIYLPAAQRLRQRCLEVIRQVLPTAGHDGAALVDLIDKRGRLEVALGVDKSALGDLQANLVVLGPLIASAAAAFLQHG